MNHHQRLNSFIVLATVIGLLLAACAPAAESTQPTEPPLPPPATQSSDAPDNGDTEPVPEPSLIEQFPEDVRPLLANIAPNLVQVLLEVRQQGPGELVWVDFGGELHDAARRSYINNWEQITGWTVIQTAPGTGPALANLQAQVDSGNPEWDIFAILNYGSAINLGNQGYFAAMDLSLFPIDQFPESSLYDPNGYWVNWTDFGIVLMWNTDAFPAGQEPQSTLDIFDLENYPGRRCLFNFVQSSGNLEFALLADGVPFEEIYALLETEEGIERALAKLDTIYDEVIFVSSGADSVQFPLDGQCDMSITFSGRPALRLLDEPDLPLDMTWNDGLISGGPIAVVEGSSNFDAAQSLVAFALQPVNNCTFLNQTAYGIIMTGPPFPDCMSDFALRFAPNLDVISGSQDGEFYFDNAALLTETWTAWQTSR